MPDHRGAIPYGQYDSPHARAYRTKREEMIAAGRSEGDAHHEASRYAREAISPDEAAHNAQVVASLGLTYGTTPTPTPQPTEPAEEAEAVDWDDIFSANRK